MHKNTYNALVGNHRIGEVVTDWTPNSVIYGVAGKISGFVAIDGLLYIKAEDYEVQAHYKKVALGDNSLAKYPD